ncbi:hypothetical protein D3C78_432870 [compost metagenome]
MFSVLEVFHLGQQHAGVGDDGAPGLEQQRQVAALDALAHGLDIVAGLRRLLVAVAHAESAAEVEMADRDAARGQAVDQRQQAVEGVEEGLQAGELGADVAVDAYHVQVRQGGGMGVDGFRFVDGDAELVFLEAGGDVGMGAGIHVGVHPQRHRGLHFHGRGHVLQALQLVARLDVEAVHAGFQGAAHVVAALADAGEDDAPGRAAGGEDAFQLAAGNDVEARPLARQQVQHAEVGVGLDRVADHARHAGQGVGIGLVAGLDMGAGVDVGGRAEPGGDIGQRYAFREQLTVAVSESVHGDSPGQRMYTSFWCSFAAFSSSGR